MACRVRAGGFYYTRGRDEPLLEWHLRQARELGSLVQNIQIKTRDIDGKAVTDDEVAELYLWAAERGEQLGVTPCFEVHVNMWPEHLGRVARVGDLVERRGVPFNITLDHSHVIFKIDNPREQGTNYPCDLALLAVGVVPNIELARDAGLATDNGIIVDEFLATTDPSIFAIGDCASYWSPYASAKVRLESVQNAVDQAKCVAANILGMPAAYTAPPWFWSDQGEFRLQIAGLTGSADDVHVIGSPSEAIAYCFRAGRLIGIETVNRPSHHMMGRKLLAGGIEVTRADLERLEFDLAAHLAAITADLAKAGGIGR